MIETERRFLLKSLPESVADLKSLIIEDNKLLTGEDHPHLRLRRKGNKWMLTKKYPKNISSEVQEMVEEEIGLNETEFQLFKQLPHIGQQKVRHYIQVDRYEGELDLWQEDLKGLGILEVEFPSVEEAAKFEMPDFCLCEITNQEWISTGKIAGKKFEDLEVELSKLGYKKLCY